MCSTLLRAMGRLSIGQCTPNLAMKAPVITAVSKLSPQSADGPHLSSRCFSKIVNDSTSSDSNSFLAPLASRFNAGSIVSILGTAPTVRGKRKAFQQVLSRFGKCRYFARIHIFPIFMTIIFLLVISDLSERTA